jgi:hypothetical protein
MVMGGVGGAARCTRPLITPNLGAGVFAEGRVLGTAVEGSGTGLTLQAVNKSKTKKSPTMQKAQVLEFIFFLPLMDEIL